MYSQFYVKYLCKWTVVEADRISFSSYFSAPENAFFSAFYFSDEKDICSFVSFLFSGLKWP